MPKVTFLNCSHYDFRDEKDGHRVCGNKLSVLDTGTLQAPGFGRRIERLSISDDVLGSFRCNSLDEINIELDLRGNVAKIWK